VLTVVAHYRATPGKGDEVEAILARHVAATRAEPGCVTFLASRSEDDPDRFLLYEQYVDESAFQAHRESPHFARNIVDGVVPLLAERVWSRHHAVEPA
jgi:quinol monooxygenase YgiN